MALKRSNSQTAVLFVLIGWARRYDGTEAIIGKHAYLQEHPEDNAEAEAFNRNSNGYYHCGVGKGTLGENMLDVVFVARAQQTQSYKVVGFYKRAKVSSIEANGWVTVRTRRALLFHSKKRPAVIGWPAGQGMRRWARRVLGKGAVHPSLLPLYRSVLLSRPRAQPTSDREDIDPELSGFVEGEQRRLFVKHRHREARLRAAKLRQALQDGNGHLRCEVPGCAFDFLRTYGGLGRRYAVVHHKKPLASLKSKGATVSLDDLAIVCANCHAMIHRDGQCRPLDEVRPRGRSRGRK